MLSDEKLLKQFDRDYKDARGGLRNQYKEIEECRRFYNGDYMNYRDTILYGRGESRKVQEVSFNRVKPYVNAFVGFFVQNRKKPMYHAKTLDETEQEAQTDYINGYSDYTRENTYADEIETKQDFDLAIGGVGITDTAITTKMGTPTRLPGGEIIVERVDPLECGWDPLAVAPALVDGNFCWRAKDYDPDDAENLFDADEDEFEGVNPTDDIHDYQYNPYGGIQDKIGYEYASSERRQVRVYFYQWFEVEKYYRVENPLHEDNDPVLSRMLQLALDNVEQTWEDEVFAFDASSEILTITKDKRKQVKEIFEAFDIPFDPVIHKRKVFYTGVLSGKTVFQKFKSVSQQGFSLKFKVGDRDDKNNIFTGIVTSMKQPQRYYNKSLTEFMLIVASNAKGGVIAERGAIGNIQEFEAKYARHNSVVEVDDLEKVRDKAAPQMNTGYEFIMQSSDEAFEKVTGINETFFGVSASGNETALLHRQRIKQATVILATYVDSVAFYLKDQARMMLSFMRELTEFNEGDLFHSRDGEGEIKFRKVSKEFLADEYAVTAREVEETDAQKDYHANVLIELATAFLGIGDVQRARPIFAMGIKQLPLLEKDKQEVIEALMGEEQIDPQMVEQLQKKIQELMGERNQVEMAKMKTDVEKGQAEIVEIYKDIESKKLSDRETEEDIESQAIQNDMLALKPLREVSASI